VCSGLGSGDQGHTSQTFAGNPRQKYTATRDVSYFALYSGLTLAGKKTVS
jgi:hypothetical protein